MSYFRYCFSPSRGKHARNHAKEMSNTTVGLAIHFLTNVLTHAYRFGLTLVIFCGLESSKQKLPDCSWSKRRSGHITKIAKKSYACRLLKLIALMYHHSN